MVKLVTQHPDGHHIVRVDDKIYVDSPDNFKKDFGVELPTLPIGIDERVYEQGVRHPLYEKNSVVDGGPMPWSVGDKLFDKIDNALSKQQQRQDKALADAAKRLDDETKRMEREIKEKIEKREKDNEIDRAQNSVMAEGRNSEKRDKANADVLTAKRHMEENEKKIAEVVIKREKEKEQRQREFEQRQEEEKVKSLKLLQQLKQTKTK